MLAPRIAPMSTTASIIKTATFEIVASADPDAPSRIVRLATTTPFVLVSMVLDPARSGRRRLRLTVARAPVGGERVGFDTLRARLDRAIDILDVTLVD